MKQRLQITFLTIMVLSWSGCESNGSQGSDYTQFLTSYAEIARISYNDSLEQAREFNETVEAFSASATDNLHTELQAAWTEMRIPYLQTEAFRFSGTPIDTVDFFAGEGIEELEGLLNAWPLDESYIDNFLAGSDEISRENLLAANGVSVFNTVSGSEENAEKNITLGFHAIEYLLWGKDDNEDGPGERSVDYFNDVVNGQRRLDFLSVASAVLVEHLELLVTAWSQDSAFRSDFISGGADSVARVITGLASFARAEWGGERLVGLTVKTQEEEHSCFSDTTFNDFYFDAQGVLNLVRGSYHYGQSSYSGTGLADLSDDTDLTDTIIDKLIESRDQYDASQRSYSFDNLIAPGVPEHADLQSFRENRAVIQSVADDLTRLADELGISVGTVEEPAPDQ